MNKKQLIMVFLVLTLVLSAKWVFAENRYHVADFDDDKSVETFANKFKEAVVKKDKEAVASMIHYPIDATLKDKAVIINNKEEFLRFYNDIFDKTLCSKIANANTHNMFANYQGVMIGNGEVWFGRDGNDVKVISVGICRRYDAPDIK